MSLADMSRDYREAGPRVERFPARSKNERADCRIAKVRTVSQGAGVEGFFRNGGRLERDSTGDLRAEAHRAFQLHGPTKRVDRVFHDRQSQPGAATDCARTRRAH